MTWQLTDGGIATADRWSNIMMAMMAMSFISIVSNETGVSKQHVVPPKAAPCRALFCTGIRVPERKSEVLQELLGSFVGSVCVLDTE